MTRLSSFVEKLKNKYGDKVVVKKSKYNDKMLSKVPKPLREFYSEYESLETPFGMISSIEIDLRDSQAEPFKSEGWFSFGEDGYFSFWLCAYTPDSEGNIFASWDHDMEDTIEAEYSNIVDFLEDMQELYEFNKTDGWDI